MAVGGIIGKSLNWASGDLALLDLLLISDLGQVTSPVRARGASLSSSVSEYFRLSADFPTLFLEFSWGDNEKGWGKWGAASTWLTRILVPQCFKVFSWYFFQGKKNERRAWALKSLWKSQSRLIFCTGVCGVKRKTISVTPSLVSTWTSQLFS